MFLEVRPPKTHKSKLAVEPPNENRGPLVLLITSRNKNFWYNSIRLHPSVRGTSFMYEYIAGKAVDISGNGTGKDGFYMTDLCSSCGSRSSVLVGWVIVRLPYCIQALRTLVCTHCKRDHTGVIPEGAKYIYTRTTNGFSRPPRRAKSADASGHGAGL